jgi:hypothetical protein
MSAIKKQQVKKHPIYDVFFYTGFGFALISLILLLVWVIPNIDFKDLPALLDNILEGATAELIIPLITMLMLSGVHFGISSHLKEQPDDAAYGLFKSYVISVFFMGLFTTIAFAAYQW